MVGQSTPHTELVGFGTARYGLCVSTIQEIEAAIRSLSPAERKQLADMNVARSVGLTPKSASRIVVNRDKSRSGSKLSVVKP
jgi:hypothetical protein